jgi:protein-S-isoprenylcysteine O-methyltransferase Ste14
MTNLRANNLIYLGALLTLSTMVLPVVIDTQSSAPVRYLAPIFGVSFLCLAFWPMFTLRQYGQTPPGESYMQTTIIVDRGLYAVVRHPQYLGYMCLNLTFMLISLQWLIILVGSSAILLIYLYALQEEKRLLKKFGGGAYHEYKDRVPQFNIISGLVRMVVIPGRDKHE